MMSNISELKDRLKANPIYALSLGSRELFHSNFLAWMFEEYPQMIGSVSDGPFATKVNVEREKLNLDLLIDFSASDERQPLVIEIKVKDVPKLAQLTEYDDKIRTKFKHIEVEKVLLSLVDAPESVKTQGTWRSLNFANLGKKIMDLIPVCKMRDDHAVIIRLYAQMCCDLGALTGQSIEADRKGRTFFFEEPGLKHLIEEVDQALDDVGFTDTLEKHRASALREEIKRQAASDGLVLYDENPGFGLANKTPHAGATVSTDLPGPTKRMLFLGVHIQGLQYRRMLSFDQYSVSSQKQGKVADELEGFIEATDNWNWMFGNSLSDKRFTGLCAQEGFFKGKADVPTSQKKLLCSYAPRHIYQYTNIGDAPKVPIDQVVSAVIADLKYAVRLLEDPAYIARFENWSPV